MCIRLRGEYVGVSQLHNEVLEAARDAGKAGEAACLNSRCSGNGYWSRRGERAHVRALTVQLHCWSLVSCV